MAIIRAPVFPRQILPNSAAQFVKFREIPRHYYPQVSYILRPVDVVVLTDNASKYKEFIATCNTKTHYVRPLMMKIHVKIHRTLFSGSTQVMINKYS